MLYHDSPCLLFSALSQCFGPCFFQQHVLVSVLGRPWGFAQGGVQASRQGKGKPPENTTMLVKQLRFPQHPFGEQRNRDCSSQPFPADILATAELNSFPARMPVQDFESFF